MTQQIFPFMHHMFWEKSTGEENVVDNSLCNGLTRQGRVRQKIKMMIMVTFIASI